MALCALAALPAAARKPLPVLKDAAALERAMASVAADEKAHDEDCRAMEALLPEFLAAADPKIRGALWSRYGALIDHANMLCERQQEHINAINIGAVSRALTPGKEAVAFSDAVIRLIPFEKEHSRLCHLNDELITKFTEAQAGPPAPPPPPPSGSPRGVALGAGLIAAASAVWALRRRPGRPAPSGDFTVGRLLGRGTLGETYEGFDKTLRRKVALKRLRPELLAAPADAQRLAAGARAAAAFGHAGLVALHSQAAQEGHYYLVFEYVDGPSLASLLSRSGSLAYSRALRVLASVAEGLEAAHAAGLVHGDVRPSDVLVAADGSAKLKGLGFASLARGTLSRVSRLESPGRFDYMAPEREIGAPDPASDTFALAACFYHMLTGRPPFAGPDALAAKRAGRFAPPRSLAPALPAGMDLFFQTALAADPAARFASPRALASAAGALR